MYGTLTAGILPLSAVSPVHLSKMLLSAIFTYIIKVDTAKKMASALHPNSTIPAKGFYIRHAKNITFDGVRFHFAQPDGRPLFVTDDAENIEYYHTPQE